MGPAPQFGVPALDTFASGAEAIAPAVAPQAECALAWPPPQEDIDAIEVIELHVDELQTRVAPKREFVLVSTAPPATAHAAGPTAVVAIQPPTAGPDIVKRNAQIRDLLRFIGRRPEDHPDAFIPLPVVAAPTARLQPRV